MSSLYLEQSPIYNHLKLCRMGRNHIFLCFTRWDQNFFFFQLFEYFKQICFVVREYYCNCYYFCFFCPTKYFWCPYMPNYYLNCSSVYSLNWMVDVKVIVVDVKCIKSHCALISFTYQIPRGQLAPTAGVLLWKYFYLRLSTWKVQIKFCDESCLCVILWIQGSVLQ